MISIAGVLVLLLFPRAAPAAIAGPEGQRGTISVSERFALCQAKKAESSPFAAPASPSDGRCDMSEDLRRGIRLVSGASPPEGKMVARPEKLYGRTPLVPPALRGSGRGEATVSAIIDEDGCLRDIRICKGDSEAFNQATLEVVGDWLFKPATLDGKPVAVYYLLEIAFQSQ
jgi:TonB family protein